MHRTFLILKGHALQYIPDLIVLTTPLGRIKNTHLPACAVLLASVLAIFGVLRWIALLQILLGIQTAWVYLRFLQAHGDGLPRGDSSDHFSWSTYVFHVLLITGCQ